MALSREEVAAHLYDAGIRGDDLWKLVAIAGRESGYKEDAHRTDQDPSKLSGDRGLFQVNYIWDQQLKDAGIIKNSSDLFDPATNAKAAAYILGEQGWSAWGVGSRGWEKGGDPLAKTNTGAAQTAVSNFLADPGKYTDGPSTGAAAAAIEVGPAPTRNTEYDPKYTPPDVDPAAQKTLTDMLSGFGIDYPEGPRATPALLTFMRGLGMSIDTAEDVRDSTIGSLEGRAADNRYNSMVESRRDREDITGDNENRNSLVSGAANKEYAEETEDTVARNAAIERGLAEGVLQTENAFNTYADSIRGRALETTIGEETRQATTEAEEKERVRAYKAALEADDYAFKRQQHATDTATKSLAEIYGR